MGGIRTDTRKPYLRIFEGSSSPPFFDFSRKGEIFHEIELPFAAPNLEINSDGRADVYKRRVDTGTIVLVAFKTEIGGTKVINRLPPSFRLQTRLPTLC